MDKEKLDELIESNPRHNIFTLLIIIVVFGGLGLLAFYKIIENIIKLF